MGVKHKGFGFVQCNLLFFQSHLAFENEGPVQGYIQPVQRQVEVEIERDCLTLIKLQRN